MRSINMFANNMYIRPNKKYCCFQWLYEILWGQSVGGKNYLRNFWAHLCPCTMGSYAALRLFFRVRNCSVWCYNTKLKKKFGLALFWMVGWETGNTIFYPSGLIDKWVPARPHSNMYSLRSEMCRTLRIWVGCTHARTTQNCHNAFL